MQGTAAKAKRRLQLVLAIDRFKHSLHRCSLVDYQRLLFNQWLKPVTLLDKFPEVHPMPEKNGSLFKWKEF